MNRSTIVLLFACACAFQWGSAAPDAHAAEPGVEVCHAPPVNPDNRRTITVPERALEAHLSHGDTEGACGEDTAACPCWSLADLQALDGGGTWLQQRWVDPDGAGGNWIGDAGFAQIIWDLEGGTCNYNDWSTSTEVTYEQALACDALLNEQSLAAGAICASMFCP